MKLIFDEQDEDIRVDSYLAEILPNFSRSKIQSKIKSGKCLVNHSLIKPSYLLKVGDVIEIEEDVFQLQKPEPENIDLDIVWEDENMLVVNKPSGMLTHPTVQEMSGTLVNALLNKFGRERLSDLNGEMRPGIVHRLDRNTSGLLMIAKNNNTHEFLVNSMKEHKFTKKYLAVVRGVLDLDEFDINSAIGRHLSQPQKMAVNGKYSKDALTKVKVLKRFDNATLVEITLVTGRTHQIRVHMASIGHPVYNDTLYGFGKIKVKTQEQVLQSYKLKFIKPFSDELITLEIEPDEKIKKVLNSFSM